MSVEARSTTTWGPLSEPIHAGAGPDDPPWRDNAYLGFWDTANQIYGAFHVSTSPNAEGRRARLSVDSGAGVAEVVEDLEPGTFSSASIAFELGEEIRVDHDELRGQLRSVPLYALADYSHNDIIPALVAGAPLQHFQRFARVTGSFEVRGQAVTVDGVGIRDRTWGFRDESVSIVEYVAVMATVDDYAFTIMRFLGADGRTRTEGFRVDEAGAVAMPDLELTRDASGLFAAGRFSVEGAPDIQLRSKRRPAAFWVPMGWERTGPTMAAYDEFCEVVTPEGRTGIALVEQGSVRRVF